VPVDDLLDILEAAETAALVREVLDAPAATASATP